MSVPPTDAEWAMGTYDWHPMDTTVVDVSAPPAMLASSWVLGPGYVIDHTYVSGPPASVPLTIVFPGLDWPLVVDGAVISATISDDGRSLSHGRIGGIVRTERIERWLEPAVISLIDDCTSAGWCVCVESELLAGADLLEDGTQDPTRVCDALSFGIGFDARLGSIGTATPMRPLVQACACLPPGG
jgi:hypothetical protein